MEAIETLSALCDLDQLPPNFGAIERPERVGDFPALGFELNISSCDWLSPSLMQDLYDCSCLGCQAVLVAVKHNDLVTFTFRVKTRYLAARGARAALLNAPGIPAIVR